jgi:hypothetical protein
MKTNLTKKDLDRKHPLYDTTVRSALRLVWNADNLGQSPKKSNEDEPGAPEDSLLPTPEYALERIQAMRRTAGFNWITGTAAAEVLSTLLGEKGKLPRVAKIQNPNL